MNRNAARHLALVVSVLLCFFVYMGYRFWGTTEVQPETAPMTAGTDTETGAFSGLPQHVTPPGASTAESGSNAGASGLRPPANTDVSLTLGGEGGGLGLTPPPGASGSSAPVGSGRESNAESITGLIPAPPSDDAPSSPMMNVPVPPGLGEADDNSGSGSGGGLALAPPPGVSSSAPRGTDLPGTLAPPMSGAPTPTNRNPASAGSSVGTSATSPSATARTSRPETTASNNDSRPGQRTTTAPEASRSTDEDDNDDQFGGNPPVRPDYPEASDSLRIYVVQPGDTLSRIATRELGSISLADNIYLLNRDVISDPDHLMVGVRIRLPVREQLGSGLPAASGGFPSAGRGEVPVGTARTDHVPEARIHRVRRGETLSNISLRYYGTSAGWRGIYDANRDILPNPNQLQVGMELIVPPYDE